MSKLTLIAAGLQLPAAPIVHPAALLPFFMPSYLLSVEADAKTDKGTASGYLTGILYLAPGTLAGVGNLCVHASAGCLAACLFTAGRAGIFEAVNAARVMRTRFLHDNRAGFIAALKGEIAALVRKAKRRGLRPVVRLNGTSDFPWEKLAPELFTDFPTVRFYDYTKSLRRAIAYAKGELPKGYHLTFSLSETNAAAAGIALAAGVNVAAVADGIKAGQRFALPGMMEARPTFSADRHDLRFLDRKGKDGRGRIGILKAKGKARADQSGFVIRANPAAAAAGMKPRPAATLTSPAPCGAFLCLSASRCNGTAQAPPLPRAALARPALPFPLSFPLPDQSKPRRRPLVPPFDGAALGKPHPAALAPPGKPRQPLCRRPIAGPAAGRPPVIQTAAAPPAS